MLCVRSDLESFAGFLNTSQLMGTIQFVDEIFGHRDRHRKGGGGQRLSLTSEDGHPIHVERGKTSRATDRTPGCLEKAEAIVFVEGHPPRH